VLFKYRTGYRTAWDVPPVRRHMQEFGFKAPGKYFRNNQQGGDMFATPREVPARFDGEAAGILLRLSFKSGLTRSQCESVRKMLSFAYQLATGKEGNYEEVKIQWDCQDPELYGAPTQKILAEVSVEPAGLQVAFTSPWSPGCGMPFPEWCVAALIVHDWCIVGARSQTDLGKIKASVQHTIVSSAGWMATAMKGGRAKLEKKKGLRPWSVYRVCFCKEGKHSGPPKGWKETLDHESNPTELNWCSECPLSCFEVVRELLPVDDHRSYPKWLRAQNRYGKDSVGKKTIFTLAQRWLNIQGANPDQLKFDSNSGRKSLGKWCDEYGTPYHESFELHGDLWKIWKRYYQHGLQKDPAMERRTQSTTPEVACRALRRFARAIGRGRTVREDPKEFDTNQIGRMLARVLRKLGEGAAVAEILDKKD
jgi:hypothetical protein